MKLHWKAHPRRAEAVARYLGWTFRIYAARDGRWHVECDGTIMCVSADEATAKRDAERFAREMVDIKRGVIS